MLFYMNVLGFTTNAAYDGELSCDCCGKTASPAGRTAGSLSELTGLLGRQFPPGSTVAVVYEREEPYMTVKRELVRGGYRLFPVHIDGQSVYEADRIRPPEHVRAVVAVGCIETVKYFAALSGLTVYAVLTEPSASVAVPAAALAFRGFRLYKTPVPAAVIADTSLMPSYAEGLGAIAAAAVSVFDGFVCSRIGRAAFCPQSASAVLKLAENVAARPRPSASDVTDVCLKLSALGRFVGDSRYCAGSVHAAAAAHRLLCEREERPAPPPADCVALLSPVLLRLYGRLWYGAKGFHPPPDNNRRLDAIESVLGVPAAYAADRVTPLMSGDELSKAAYLLRLYARDIRALYARCRTVTDKLFHLYRRLSPDGGYSLVNALDVRDAELAFALSPDIGGWFTVLTYLKNLGMLDGYLEFVV